MSERTVSVHVEKSIIHWHRTPACDAFWCGACGPDILFTQTMRDVTCNKCLSGMYRTKEYRYMKNAWKKIGKLK